MKYVDQTRNNGIYIYITNDLSYVSGKHPNSIASSDVTVGFRQGQVATLQAPEPQGDAGDVAEESAGCHRRRGSWVQLRKRGV